MALVKFEEAPSISMRLSLDVGSTLKPSLVQGRMREGKITVLSERGVEEDAGRYRLTFFYENRRFRLVVDEEGNAVQRSTVDFGDQPLPASMRKPSARLCWRRL